MLTRAVVAVGALCMVSAVVSACGAAENAAARDPMRCERDPTCARARASFADCSKQCSDNPDCVDRCRQAQADRMGHP
jgi:hypothetical protein